MSDDIIIQHLKDKELQLLTELNRVRIALKAFIDDNINFSDTNFNQQSIIDIIPHQYDSSLTYSAKILYILAREGKPMLVDEITTAVKGLEPGLEIDKLHKSIGYNLSMLAKYSRVKKHPFNRKIKYSV
jgi:hypothetical protein